MEAARLSILNDGRFATITCGEAPEARLDNSR